MFFYERLEHLSNVMKIPVEELVESMGIKWTAFLAMRNRKSNPSSKVKILSEWLAGRELTGATMTQFFEYLHRERSSSCHENYYSHLGLILSGVGERHILEKVRKVKANATPAKYFQRAQIEKLKMAMLEKDPDLWFACQWLYYCFIRPGELRSYFSDI